MVAGTGPHATAKESLPTDHPLADLGRRFGPQSVREVREAYARCSENHK